MIYLIEIVLRDQNALLLMTKRNKNKNHDKFYELGQLPLTLITIRSLLRSPGFSDMVESGSSEYV